MDSKLQIISGRFRGRKLYLPTGARPTQNRARAAVFNMLAAGLVAPDAALGVWDAFAGSGAFGIECLSRYPNAAVVFTDISPASVATIKKNLGALGGNVSGVVHQMNAVDVVDTFGPNADLVFIDAPYDSAELGMALVQQLTQVARPGTLVVWEQDDTDSSNMPDGWCVLRDKKYGRARFIIARRG